MSRSGISRRPAIPQCYGHAVVVDGQHAGLPVGRQRCDDRIGVRHCAERGDRRATPRQPCAPGAGRQRGVASSAGSAPPCRSGRPGAADPRSPHAARRHRRRPARPPAARTRPTLKTASSNSTEPPSSAAGLVGGGGERRDPHDDGRFEAERDLDDAPPAVATDSAEHRRGSVVGVPSSSRSNLERPRRDRHRSIRRVDDAPQRSSADTHRTAEPEPAPSGDRRAHPQLALTAHALGRRSGRVMLVGELRPVRQAVGGEPEARRATRAPCRATSKPGPRLADDAGTRSDHSTVGVVACSQPATRPRSAPSVAAAAPESIEASASASPSARFVGPAGDDQRRGGVEQHDVAVRRRARRRAPGARPRRSAPARRRPARRGSPAPARAPPGRP